MSIEQELKISVDLNLWDRIKRFELDDHEAGLTFTRRLARENNWDLNFAIRVIHEYKKFIYLICITDHPLTPSDEVDQAWHLHLVYSRSYWQELCGETLKREIHHGPTKGGRSEDDKFHDWYEKTKRIYQFVFDKFPPEDIWPDSQTRFGEMIFARVNLSRNWVISKPKLLYKWKN